MAYEAVCCGLELDPVTLNFDRYDDFLTKVPSSVTWKWKLLEWIPVTRVDYNPPSDSKSWWNIFSAGDANNPKR